MYPKTKDNLTLTAASVKQIFSILALLAALMWSLNTTTSEKFLGGMGGEWRCAHFIAYGLYFFLHAGLP